VGGRHTFEQTPNLPAPTPLPLPESMPTECVNGKLCSHVDSGVATTSSDSATESAMSGMGISGATVFCFPAEVVPESMPPMLLRTVALVYASPSANYQIRTQCNNTLSSYLTVSYDSIKNIYVFTRTEAQDTTLYYMYIKPINSGSFFGLKNNVEYEISFSSNSSKNPLNVIGISKINIVIDGDIIFSSNNLHNYKDHNMEPRDIKL
jgi:hypothetical protein